MVMGELSQDTEVLVIGGGPGGYAAAFRAADLGMDVALVEKDPRPGGECLFRGCIPSKTLLHLSDLIFEARRSAGWGVSFGPPEIDLGALRGWKDKVIDDMADGLETLCKRRGVQLIRGRAVFEGPDRARVFESDVGHIRFKHAIIATGSDPAPFQGTDFRKGGRIMDSAGALELEDIPESLLISGGGYVALEMGTIYASLGTRVTVIVRSERILRGADEDLTLPLQRRVKEIFHGLHFHTEIASMEEDKAGVRVLLKGEMEGEETFDRVLIAVGRRPKSKELGLDTTGVRLDKKGFVKVDDRLRTTAEKIYAVGDVAGEPLLAHKAFREGKVAAEVIKGEPSAFDARAIPAVVFTDPQIAWCGLTEEQARREKRPVRVARFPWKFSGRATSMGAQDGLTKLILEPETERILGVGIVGRDTEGLIAEGVLAVEMGALAEDMALSIHAHPTLTETLGEAAERFLGSSTHILPSKR
jgi:dihydrolipoamide dehydrogenase